MATDAALARSLRLLIASEVFGVEVFAAAERRASGSDRRVWEALHALEQQTRAAVLERFAPEVAAMGRSQRVAAAVGKGSGSAMTVLPRPLQMRSVVLGTVGFLPHFRRLQAHHAGSAQAPFFDYVLAHEHAIAEVGRRALHHDVDAAAPVEALLGPVP